MLLPVDPASAPTSGPTVAIVIDDDGGGSILVAEFLSFEVKPRPQRNEFGGPAV